MKKDRIAPPTQRIMGTKVLLQAELAANAKHFSAHNARSSDVKIPYFGFMDGLRRFDGSKRGFAAEVGLGVLTLVSRPYGRQANAMPVAEPDTGVLLDTTYQRLLVFRTGSKHAAGILGILHVEDIGTLATGPSVHPDVVARPTKALIFETDTLKYAFTDADGELQFTGIAADNEDGYEYAVEDVIVGECNELRATDISESVRTSAVARTIGSGVVGGFRTMLQERRRR